MGVEVQSMCEDGVADLEEVGDVEEGDDLSGCQLLLTPFLVLL